MNREHWEQTYKIKQESDVSWHQDEPTLSFKLIREFTPAGGSVIDAGGGSSILAGRLVEAGFRNCAVLDISETALLRARQRIGVAASRQLRWIACDITKAPADLGQFDVWHDRAVFHFFTNPDDRKSYISAVRRAVPVGGHVIIGTFALDGPEKCSGLDVERYDGKKLAARFGEGFSLKREIGEVHTTPWGKPQLFTYSVMERIPLVNKSPEVRE